MATWLFKTEPNTYSFFDLENDEATMWDGVTNALALKHLRTVEEGDTVLIYHSGDEKKIVGVAEVSREAYLPEGEIDPKKIVCDIAFVRFLDAPITLAQVKAEPELSTWELVRLSRLSVVPVNDEVWTKLQTWMV
ncbi:EVE domain-containing protein [bacterium]|nr:MAG: EVE domain-containing protein [bacterium]